jgi:ribose 5-phosphate isomerase RpiB
MRVAMGSDHAGFELKKRVREFLAEWNHDMLDMGTHKKFAIAVDQALQ